MPGFTEHLDSGAQVFSIINSYLVKPNLSTTETFGFIREKIFGTNEQPFGPDAIPGGAAGTGSINVFGSKYFPGVSVYNVLGDYQPQGTSTAILNIGPNAEGQAPNTGVFQNRLAPSGNAIWMLGKHTVSFGASYSYTQLNTIDKRTGTGTVATDDFSQMIQGFVTPGSSTTGFYVSSFLQGDASRYYRSNQLGTYLQDKWQITPSLSLTAGVRYDWDGGLTEKYGRIFNFDPKSYSYNVASDTIENPGLIIAGNNANGTKGVSNTTLTGRQWGIAPRVGAAWQPGFFHNKVVVRAGGGIYYDRGELFSYFSPGYAIGTVTGGPFGVNQQLPFVNASTCPIASRYLYEGYISTCGGSDAEGNLENPYGTSLQYAAPSSPKASDLGNFLPNAAGIMNNGQPISLGVYDRANKLPYTMNYTLDIQWQPRNDLAIEVGYVGNRGRHQVIPVPFNQPVIASPGSPTLSGSPYQQNYSYGYTVSQPDYGPPLMLDDGTSYLANYEGGNVDLRVPYIGYAAESITYKAAGVDAYNALQAHVDKRMSHGIQARRLVHLLACPRRAERPGPVLQRQQPAQPAQRLWLGRLRPHPRAQLQLRLPASEAGAGVDDHRQGRERMVAGRSHRAAERAALQRHRLLRRGRQHLLLHRGRHHQPHRAAGQWLHGKEGARQEPPAHGLRRAGSRRSNPACFTLPLLPAGGLGGAIPSTDPYETGFTSGQRNIFRQSFQKRADASLVKAFSIKERYNLKYTFDVYNLTNTTSFDVPGNEVSQNEDYNAFPATGTTPLPTGCDAEGNQTNRASTTAPAAWAS